MRLDLAALWRRMTGRKATTLDVFRDVYGGWRESATGRSVTVQTALEVATVLACCRVLADGIAQVPLRLMREDGRSRLPATDHPLYRVLNRRPNPWQTSYEFRETLAFHALLCGNFYAFKNTARGRITELIPFDPGMVTVTRQDDLTLTYAVTLPSGAHKVFPQEAIWHLRGPSWNTWMGMQGTALAREAIGLAMAAEESQARLHSNGARTSGLYSVEGTLNETQYKALREWIEREAEGLANAWRPMVLDRNAKFTPVAMTGVDAQHLETRRFQIEEICRAFRVMPIMVGYSDNASTYASAEQMFLAHVVHTLMPWYERIEQSIDVNLLTERDLDAGIYSAFDESGLLRGAMLDTSEYLAKLVTNGILTRNEARERLDLNPLDGLDEPITPANMTVGAKPAGVTEDANTDMQPA